MSKRPEPEMEEILVARRGFLLGTGSPPRGNGTGGDLGVDFLATVAGLGVTFAAGAAGIGVSSAAGGAGMVTVGCGRSTVLSIWLSPALSVNRWPGTRKEAPHLLHLALFPAICGGAFKGDWQPGHATTVDMTTPQRNASSKTKWM